MGHTFLSDFPLDLEYSEAMEGLQLLPRVFRTQFLLLGRWDRSVSSGQTANLSGLCASCSGGFVSAAGQDSLRGQACHLARQAVARRTLWLCSWMREWTWGQV